MPSILSNHSTLNFLSKPKNYRQKQLMIHEFKKYHHKFTALALLIAATGTGCTSTNAPPPDSSKARPYQVLSATILVHKEKGNASTADFQACRYNNEGDSASTDRCMKERGWETVTVKELPVKKYHGKEKIEACLNKSKVNNKIDFELMNQCINDSTETEGSCIDKSKVNNKIDLDALNRCTGSSNSIQSKGIAPTIQ